VKFGCSHVHDIVNLGSTPAISVHVYGPRLTAMTYYRLGTNGLETGRTVRYHLGAEVDCTRPRRPASRGLAHLHRVARIGR
jgi:hypothetical protein